MIGERELIAAMNGHAKRTETITGTVEQIEQILMAEQIDAAEATTALSTLSAYRINTGMDEDEVAPWSGGVIDGLIIGVRAGREEAIARAPEIADEAIGMFLERLEHHGQSIEGSMTDGQDEISAARAEAIQEVREGMSVRDEDLRP